jgi:hypothetical protein
MPIALSRLIEEARLPFTETARTLNEAQLQGRKTAFLCHSHHDASLVMGFVRLLNAAGWDVYVDWRDASMPPIPNRVTAQKIQQRIVATDYFLFLATPNSVVSRWCPWEIGYADGVKHIDTILVVTTTDAKGTYGNEYLQLYRRIDFSHTGQLAAFMPGQTTGVFVRSL